MRRIDTSQHRKEAREEGVAILRPSGVERGERRGYELSILIGLRVFQEFSLNMGMYACLVALRIPQACAVSWPFVAVPVIGLSSLTCYTRPTS